MKVNKEIHINKTLASFTDIIIQLKFQIDNNLSSLKAYSSIINTSK